MRRLALAAALAGAAIAVAPLAIPAAADAATRDWAKMATVTPDGTFVLGNPKAKVRLVEYLSMTCSHCAHFTTEASAPLTDKYIRGGLVALEVRHAIRDSLDVTASLLARCNGPRAYFPAAQMLLASQEQWVRDAVAFQEGDKGATAKLPIGEALAALAHGAGLDRMMATRGLQPARAKACLANKAEQDRLAAMAKEAWGTRQIQGTPSFLINGTPVEGATTWAALEPKLQEALRPDPSEGHMSLNAGRGGQQSAATSAAARPL